MGLLTLRYSEPLIMRFGARTLLFPGLALIARRARAVHAGAAPTAATSSHVLPAIAPDRHSASRVCFPALMTLAMSGATPEDAGLASGLINTTAQVGGALGLAVLATVSEFAHRHAARRGQAARVGADERLSRGLLDRRGPRGRGDRGRGDRAGANPPKAAQDASGESREAAYSEAA